MAKVNKIDELQKKVSSSLALEALKQQLFNAIDDALAIVEDKEDEASGILNACDYLYFSELCNDIEDALLDIFEENNLYKYALTK